MRYKFGKMSFRSILSLALIGCFVFLFGWLIKNDKKGSHYSKLGEYVEIPSANADAPGGGGFVGCGCGSGTGCSSGAC